MNFDTNLRLSKGIQLLRLMMWKFVVCGCYTMPQNA